MKKVLVADQNGMMLAMARRDGSGNCYHSWIQDLRGLCQHTNVACFLGLTVAQVGLGGIASIVIDGEKFEVNKLIASLLLQETGNND